MLFSLINKGHFHRYGFWDFGLSPNNCPSIFLFTISIFIPIFTNPIKDRYAEPYNLVPIHIHLFLVPPIPHRFDKISKLVFDGVLKSWQQQLCILRITHFVDMYINSIYSKTNTSSCTYLIFSIDIGTWNNKMDEYVFVWHIIYHLKGEKP